MGEDQKGKSAAEPNKWMKRELTKTLKSKNFKSGSALTNR
jgi:hypothetical protein